MTRLLRKPDAMKRTRDRVGKRKILAKYLAWRNLKALLTRVTWLLTDDLENLPEAEISAGRWYSSRFNIEPTRERENESTKNSMELLFLSKLKRIAKIIINCINRGKIHCFFLILIKDILFSNINFGKRKKN